MSARAPTVLRGIVTYGLVCAFAAPLSCSQHINLLANLCAASVNCCPTTKQARNSARCPLTAPMQKLPAHHWRLVGRSAACLLAWMKWGPSSVSSSTTGETTSKESRVCKGSWHSRQGARCHRTLFHLTPQAGGQAQMCPAPPLHLVARQQWAAQPAASLPPTKHVPPSTRQAASAVASPEACCCSFGRKSSSSSCRWCSKSCRSGRAAGRQ